MKHRGMFIVFIIGAVLVLASCAETVKRKTTQTVTTLNADNKPVTVVTVTDEKLPKDIAFKEAITEERSTCIPAADSGGAGKVNLSLINPMELKSGAAQDRYIQEVSRGQLMNITQTALGIIEGNPVVACHESITKEAIAYFEMEAQRSSNRWSFGKFLAGTAAVAYSINSVAGAVAATGAVGDSYVGELNISGSSSGGAGGGEGVAGLGGALDQNINIGNGTQNRAAGNLNFGRNPINGNENSPQDNDGGNTAKLF